MIVTFAFFVVFFMSFPMMATSTTFVHGEMSVPVNTPVSGWSTHPLGRGCFVRNLTGREVSSTWIACRNLLMARTKSVVSAGDRTMGGGQSDLFQNRAT